ncbi:hypothetical protein, partial [Desulfovibrio sp.]|uniref:hypothetical protein n=1 Tax=Desulfovibrio sp. TaxID=885 RepID=UPI0035B18C03
NAYFANSSNTSHRLRFAAASLRKATPRPAFDDERRKAEAQEKGEEQRKVGVWCGRRRQKTGTDETKCFYV